jgi:hypothetical protein
VELVLTLLPLNPVGQYDSISHWDFTETLADAGTVGAILLQVFSLFEDPGRFLYDQIINLIRDFVGGLIAVAVDTFFDLTGLDDLLADAVNGFIEGNAFLSQLRQAGLDLRDMVTHLEVISSLTIGKIGSDYQVYGSDDWLGLAIYWRWNCADNPDPQCGRHELSLDPNSSLGLVYGEWNGQVSAYNQLQIYPHAINLQYGRLIVYVLNEIILPQLTDGNAHSMTDAILYWIGCEDFGLWVTGSDGEICALGFCLQSDSIATACESVVRTVFGIGEFMLGNLEVESVMEMSGSATLVEEDGDLEVDNIIDGQYSGTVNISGSRSPFSATWSATKRPRNDGEQ